MEEIHEVYKKRAVRNIFYLIGRSGVLQIINFVGAFALTILLEPKIFGIFAVVSALINFLNYFSDIGLAASLVQKKEEIEEEELKSIFTIQQILVIAMCVLAVIFSKFVVNLYKLDWQGELLYFALLASFLFSSLKTIPSVLLERELHFEKLVIPQIVESVFFNVTAVILAFKGYGVLAFAWAVFLRGLSGLIVLYLIKPWRVGFSFKILKYKRHLKFGLPFQANSLLAMVKDDLLTVTLGKILSLYQLGLIGWGQKWAFMPLRFILDNVAKISFSALSRIQDDKEKLTKAVNKAIFGSSFLTLFILVVANVGAQFLVDVIPKYQKWAPALPFLVYFSINAAMACVFINLVNFLNSVGKVKLTLKLMVFWTVLSWVLNIGLIYLFGSIGVGFATVLMGLASLIVIFYVKDMIKIDYGSFLFPAGAAIFSMLVTFILIKTVPLEKNFLIMILFSGVAGVSYLIFSYVVFGKKIKEEIAFIKTNFAK